MEKNIYLKLCCNRYSVDREGADDSKCKQNTATTRNVKQFVRIESSQRPVVHEEKHLASEGEQRYLAGHTGESEKSGSKGDERVAFALFLCFGTRFTVFDGCSYEQDWIAMSFFLLPGLVVAGYLGSAAAYIRYFPSRQHRIGRYATGLLIAALVFHSAFLVMRAIRSGHAPFVGLHESMSFFAWLVTVVYLILEVRFRDKSLGAFVTPLIVAAQIVSMAAIRPEDPLPPLLQSPWFTVHVTASFMAYAAFFFSFITGLLYVTQAYYLHRRHVGLIFPDCPLLKCWMK